MTWKIALGTAGAVVVLLTAGIGAVQYAATDRTPSPGHAPVSSAPPVPAPAPSTVRDGTDFDDVQTEPAPEETFPPCTPGAPGEAFMCVHSATP